MAVFKRDLTPLSVHGKKGDVHKHQGKGSTQERLPSRHAMSKIAGGSQDDRSMNEYAKATPTIQDTDSMGPGSPVQMPGTSGVVNGVGNDNM